MIGAHVVGDVVAVVLEGRGVDRQEPQAIDAQLVEVIELRGEPLDVAVSAAFRHRTQLSEGGDVPSRAVAKGAHVDLVEHRFLVPQTLAVGELHRHGLRRLR